MNNRFRAGTKTRQTRSPGHDRRKSSAATAIQIAGDVVAKFNRQHPADAVLRETLRARNLFGPEAREISRRVFAYYRWLGWLDQARSLPFQIEQAFELANAFVKQPRSFSDEELIERAIPRWLHEEMKVTADWVRTIQTEPVVWLRARRGQGRTLAEKLGSAEIASLPDAILYRGDDDLFRRPEFHAGEFEIQDIGSQAVGWLCNPRPGETWWDACAGEGGKTLHLSDLMENQGLIWASDRAAWRLQILKRRAARARVFNYRLAKWDGGKKLPTKTRFDGVLVDAPCSGVGTWQRNPHARWTTTPADVTELAALQKQLLANAAKAVKPGGRIFFAVCTLTHAETRGVVEAFGEANSEFTPCPLAALPVEGKSGCALSSAPTATVSPQIFGGNGMFVAAWRRATTSSTG